MTAKLDLVPDTSFIREARSFVTAALGRDDIDALFLIAVSEVVTNAIEEHRRIGSRDPVRIEVDAASGTVRVSDRGRGFRPDPTPTRPDPLGDRGRGLMIAQAVVADLSWEPNSPSGTVVTLTCP